MAKKKALKLTIAIDEDFVADAVTEEAKQRGLSPEQMVLEIIRDWYDGLPGAQDLADHKAALEEYKENGGVEARELFRGLTEERQGRALSGRVELLPIVDNRFRLSLKGETSP